MEEFIQQYWWLAILAAIGFAVLALMIILVIPELINYMIDKKKKKKIKEASRHRFDKAPTANCYCVDCNKFDKDDIEDKWGTCSKFDWNVADNWFCWDADIDYYKKDSKNENS